LSAHWEVEYTREFERWWYEKFVPLADDLYDRHLVELEREGLIDG